MSYSHTYSFTLGCVVSTLSLTLHPIRAGKCLSNTQFSTVLCSFLCSFCPRPPPTVRACVASILSVICATSIAPSRSIGANRAASTTGSEVYDMRDQSILSDERARARAEERAWAVAVCCRVDSSRLYVSAMMHAARGRSPTMTQI